MYLIILRIVVTLTILALVLTQIVIPIIKNRKTFPMFNKKKNSARQKLIDINEELDIIEYEDETMRKLFRERNKQHQNN